MPAIYHLRRGLPPHNIANLSEEEEPIEFIEENFSRATFKFLGTSFKDNIPIIDPSFGQANHNSKPDYVVIQVSSIDLPHAFFSEVGFYLVEDVKPA